MGILKTSLTRLASNSYIQLIWRPFLWIIGILAVIFVIYLIIIFVRKFAK